MACPVTVIDTHGCCSWDQWNGSRRT